MLGVLAAVDVFPGLPEATGSDAGEQPGEHQQNDQYGRDAPTGARPIGARLRRNDPGLHEPSPNA